MNNTLSNRYSFSITKGSLFVEETILILRNFDVINLLDNNELIFDFLPQKSETGQQTVGKEIVNRIQSTDWNEMWLNFFDFSAEDQKMILLYVAASHHEILQDCLIEVYHKRWLNMNNTLSREDIGFWIDEKANVRPEILEIKEYTRKKVAQVLFRFLYEAGLIIDEAIVSVQMPPDLIHMFLNKGEKWFLDVTHQKL